MCNARLFINFSGRSAFTGLWLGALCGALFPVFLYFPVIESVTTSPMFAIIGSLVGCIIGGISGGVLALFTLFTLRRIRQRAYYRLAMSYAGVITVFLLTIILTTAINRIFSVTGQVNPVVPLLAATIASSAALYAVNLGVNWYFKELYRLRRAQG